MRKYFFGAGLCLILSFSCAFSQQMHTLSLTVHAELEEGERIFVAGNTHEMGNWNPGAVPLNRIDENTWNLQFSFPTETILEFKFTLGSWESEALNDQKQIPQNHSIILRSDTNIVYSVKYWRSDGINVVRGQVTGEVKYFENFKGDGLKPRDVSVWLPPGYDENPEFRYPVLYMHDGQNIFDPATSTLGIDWALDETADSLIRNDLVSPFVIVGINNTSDRNAEYNNTELGWDYINFLINDLKPFIDENFRTLPDRDNTFVGGSSMGGLISFMLAWEHPEIFAGAACLSPAFKIQNIDYVSVVNSSHGNKDVTLYIDNGGIGLEAMLRPGIDEMIRVLQNKGFVENQNLFIFFDLNARHNEAFWAKRSHLFLELFFGE